MSGGDDMTEYCVCMDIAIFGINFSKINYFAPNSGYFWEILSTGAGPSPLAASEASTGVLQFT